MNHASASNGNFIRAADIWDDKTTLTGFFDSISPSKSKLRSGIHLIVQHILYELDAGSRAFIKWRQGLIRRPPQCKRRLRGT